YAHAESVGGDDGADFFGHERVLNFMTPGVIESGVITGSSDFGALQNVHQLIDCPAGRSVHHGQSFPAAEDFDETCLLLGVVLGGNDVVGKVRPVESGDD